MRAAVERKDLSRAAAIVDGRLSSSPDDLEAQAWHARLLAWTGEWNQAEAQYRHILMKTPKDTDILLGLADVLVWQEKFNQALPLLDQAEECGAPPAEVLTRRARVLLRINQRNEAQLTYQALLAIDPNNPEAESALASLMEERRYEVRIGSDSDLFNYTNAAQAQAINLNVGWNSRWSSASTATFYQRFGEAAEKLAIDSSYRLTPRDSLRIGGGLANTQPVTSRREFVAEYVHGFKIRSTFLRGLESSAQQRSLWFTGSQVASLGGSGTAYLPGDCTWTLTVIAARSHFDHAGTVWTPSGSTRIGFPIGDRLHANVSFAVGTENFFYVDQIGRFSARTFGTGLRYQINRFQDISGSAAFQNRTRGQTQTSLGLSYGFRF